MRRDELLTKLLTKKLAVDQLGFAIGSGIRVLVWDHRIGALNKPGYRTAMTINLKPETEQLVREELQNGHFRSVDEMIVEGVQARREGKPLSRELRRKTPAKRWRTFASCARETGCLPVSPSGTSLTKAGLDSVRPRQLCHHALVL
jgi:hypothetical protein